MSIHDLTPKQKLHNELLELEHNLACGITAISITERNMHRAPTSRSRAQWLKLRRQIRDEMQVSGLRIWDIAVRIFSKN